TVKHIYYRRYIDGAWEAATDWFTEADDFANEYSSFLAVADKEYEGRIIFTYVTRLVSPWNVKMAALERASEEVTYYFNSRSTGNWTDPDNMIDGDTGTDASTASNGTTERLDGNTCPGTDLGTITKVEVRVYGYGDGDDRIDLWQTLYEITMPTTPGWSAYVDVTSTINTWDEVVTQFVDIEFNKVGKGGTMRCAKVEIRVTYTPTGAKTTQYLAGNDCPVFPHEMDIQSDKLPCPPPY
ncbi:hypothetical protein LCGC14_2661040, partial [marine sediment metagenome]